jgi:hypothetical protein
VGGLDGSDPVADLLYDPATGMVWLGTMTIQRDTKEETVEGFLQRFPVGMRLEMIKTTEIKPLAMV